MVFDFGCFEGVSKSGWDFSASVRVDPCGRSVVVRWCFLDGDGDIPMVLALESLLTSATRRVPVGGLPASGSGSGESS